MVLELKWENQKCDFKRKTQNMANKKNWLTDYERVQRWKHTAVCPSPKRPRYKSLGSFIHDSLTLTVWSQFQFSEPIDGLSPVLYCKPLRDIRKWFQIALDQGFDKVAGLIRGVSFRHIHHKWFDHQSPWSSINNLWVERNDWRVVLENQNYNMRSICFRQLVSNTINS